MRTVTTVMVAILGLCFAPLSLAAFASINPNVSDVLRFLSIVEGTFAAGLSIASLDAFWRGLLYLLLCVGLIWVAAFIKPRP